MASSKNPGQKLYFSRLGGELPIPPKFLAAMERKETRQKVNNDVKPEPLSDEVIESETTTDNTNEKLLRTVKKKPGNIVLRDIRTNDQGQPVQVVLTLFRTNDRKFVRDVPTLTRTTATEDLGNEWSIQETLIEGRYDASGKFIEEPFQNIELATERSEWVPDKFGVERTQTQEVISGTVAQPTLAAEDLRISERQLSLYKKLVSKLTHAGVEFPVVLVSKRTNQQKQVVTVTETLRLVSASPVPSATQDSVTQDLGNGYEVVITEVVPSVFADSTFTKQVEDAVPIEFRVALPTTDTTSASTGSAIMPTLGSGDLLATQRQITEFTKLVRLVTRSGLSLPVSLVGKDTNDRGQVVTITRTYRVTGTDPVPTATKEVAVQTIGDGRVVETTREIDAVFGKNLYEKQIIDILPEDFKAALAALRTDVITEGTAEEPTLSVGDLRKSEEQITVFTKIASTLSRAGVSLPAVITNTATMTEYGGGLVTIIRTLADAGTLAPQEGEGYVASRVTKLGEGHEWRETIVRFAGAWPIETGTEIDRRTGLAIPLTRQVLANGVTGGISGDIETEVQPIDGYRARKIIRSMPTSAIDAYFRDLHNNTNIDLPAELQSLTFFSEPSGQSGAYNETGTYAIGGPNGSGGLSLRGNATCAAAVAMEISFGVKEPRGDSVPCRHFLFYVVNGASRATILSRLTTYMTGTVNEWPRWSPRGVVIVVKGSRISLSLDLSATAHDSVVTDYNGVLKASGGSRTSGYGRNLEIGLNTKTIRLPPTVHPALVFTNNGTTSGSDSISATAEGSMSTGASGGFVNTGVLTVSATGTVSIQNSGATAGAQTIPTTGYYLHQLVTEPDPVFNRTRVFAEVIDFSLIV